jgi:pterin-4a-carbinolamine dehydratase
MQPMLEDEKLSTHSADGLTKSDFHLAGKIQKIHGQ